MLTKEEVAAARTAKCFSSSIWKDEEGNLWPAACIAQLRGCKYIPIGNKFKIDDVLEGPLLEALDDLCKHLGVTVNTYCDTLRNEGAGVFKLFDLAESKSEEQL